MHIINHGSQQVVGCLSANASLNSTARLLTLNKIKREIILRIFAWLKRGKTLSLYCCEDLSVVAQCKDESFSQQQLHNPQLLVFSVKRGREVGAPDLKSGDPELSPAGFVRWFTLVHS